MPYPTRRAVATAVMLAIAGFAFPPAVQAQAISVDRPVPVAVRLAALSTKRAARWAAAAPVIHCSPAPLTEPPGSAGELARPRVAPLEDAFLDAATAAR